MIVVIDCFCILIWLICLIWLIGYHLIWLDLMYMDWCFVILVVIDANDCLIAFVELIDCAVIWIDVAVWGIWLCLIVVILLVLWLIACAILCCADGMLVLGGWLIDDDARLDIACWLTSWLICDKITCAWWFDLFAWLLLCLIWWLIWLIDVWFDWFDCFLMTDFAGLIADSDLFWFDVDWLLDLIDWFWCDLWLSVDDICMIACFWCMASGFDSLIFGVIWLWLIVCDDLIDDWWVTCVIWMRDCLIWDSDLFDRRAPPRDVWLIDLWYDDIALWLTMIVWSCWICFVDWYCLIVAACDSWWLIWLLDVWFIVWLLIWLLCELNWLIWLIWWWVWWLLVLVWLDWLIDCVIELIDFDVIDCVWWLSVMIVVQYDFDCWLCVFDDVVSDDL